ncbi:MAG: hypothetical protein ACI9C1_003332 [Candidatus Aldehydirespiratoraceae bacterium]
MVVVMSLILATQPVAAVTPLLEIDVGAFSSRAEAWTSARDTLRADSLQQAVQIAEDVRQAAADQVAADETARVVELQRQAAAVAAATTTSPPTTVAPTTAPPTTAPPTTPAPTTQPPTATVPGDSTPPATTEPSAESPTAAQWNVLRQCESSGNYSAVSADGRYRGSYQFSQATWDWVASLDDQSLVGVDPAAAAPTAQDAMAFSLWSRQGWRPWPLCGPQAAAS